MAYTFGGATTDRIDFTTNEAFNANRVGFACGWVYPTTLAVDNILWNSGAASGLGVHPSVSTSVTLYLHTATTDGQYSAPMGFVANTWTFVAMLWNQGSSTGPVGAVRMWSATPSTGPVEQTVTVTVSPSGAWVGSGTVWDIGNTSTGAGPPWQGDIGGIVMAVDITNSNLSSICGIPANGALTQAQADSVLASWVTPAWRGDIAQIAGMGRMQYAGNTQRPFQVAASLDNSVAGGAWSIRKALPPTLGTITGATPSTRRTPHSFDDQTTNLIGRRCRPGYLVRV